MSSLLLAGCKGEASTRTGDGGMTDAGHEAATSPRADGGGRDGARGGRDARVIADSAIPRIVGDFWTVAHNPDLGTLGAPGQQVVDFGVWQAGDGTWQLWSCIRWTNVGGNTRLFYRWEGKNLTDPDWTPQRIAMQADPSLGETAGGIQAPFVIQLAGVWHMFYGDWEHICHATSTDGKTFTRVIGADGKTGLFTEGIGLNTRDPMLLHEGATNYLYYATSDGADHVRTTSDLSTFSPSTRVAFGGAAGTIGGAAECPFVAHPAASGPYFLFRTQQYGTGATTRVYRSTDPKNFGIDDDADFLVATLPLAAPEIVRDGARYYIAALRGDLAGIQIARIEFAR